MRSACVCAPRVSFMNEFDRLLFLICTVSSCYSKDTFSMSTINTEISQIAIPKPSNELVRKYAKHKSGNRRRPRRRLCSGKPNCSFSVQLGRFGQGRGFGLSFGRETRRDFVSFAVFGPRDFSPHAFFFPEEHVSPSLCKVTALKQNIGIISFQKLVATWPSVPYAKLRPWVW